MIRSFTLVLLASTIALAEPPAEEVRHEVPSFEVKVIGRKNTSRVAGSAHVVKEEELERFEYDDIQRTLKKVPGVYVREEDGAGLRPNIGMRGANSDRSAKITLMEDGVLVAPAPYSASAAYYFPLATRLTGIEVFKGPASIRSGPNTVGGVVNLLTRRIPSKTEGAVDMAAGSYGTAKLHGWAGTRTEHAGFVLEGVRLQSDGFKELDGGGDTGFGKNEVMFKGQLNTDASAPTMHKLELKLGWADERSNETYTGLTDEDLRATPQRRYAGTARDLMNWWRTEAELAHTFHAGGLEIRTVAYRHDQHRAWQKLNRFREGPALSDLLHAPQGAQAVYAAILRGELDSETPEQALLLGTNDRRFVSQGVQSTGRWEVSGFGLTHELYFGARAHYDSINRHHTEEAWLMHSGTLVNEGSDLVPTATNTGEALAFAVHALDEIGFGKRLTVSPGVRVEHITTWWDDELHDEQATRSGFVVLPGLGASWAFDRRTSAFAGAHRGFSPVTPGQAEGVKPETSINVEAGVRRQSRRLHLELIGYWNRYQNLVGQCTFSSGCDQTQIDSQFNGGEVDIYGAELLASASRRLPGGLELGGTATYTLTLSHFLSSFRSGFSQFGNVTAGDALPYVPVHQASGTVSLSHDKWELAVSGAWVSPMRDQAGAGDIDEGTGTDQQLTFDAVGSWKLTGSDSLYVKADNVLDRAVVTSRRPYGARTGKPRTLMLGYKHAFGG